MQCVQRVGEEVRNDVHIGKVDRHEHQPEKRPSGFGSGGIDPVAGKHPSGEYPGQGMGEIIHRSEKSDEPGNFVECKLCPFPFQGDVLESFLDPDPSEHLP